MKPVLILFGIACIFTTNLQALELRILTEEFPPFNYMENGKISGFSTEIVRAMLKESEISATIEMYSWARAFYLAKNVKNVAIYSMVRNDERENQFKWVGPIYSSRGYVYRRRDRKDIEISKIEDAANFKLGLIRDYAIAQKLLAKDEFVADKNVFLVAREEQLILLLLRRRIELTIMTEPSLVYRAKQMGVSINKLEKAFLMDETFGYIGVNKQTSDTLVIRLNAALSRIKKNGTHQQIKRRYLID